MSNSLGTKADMLANDLASRCQFSKEDATNVLNNMTFAAKLKRRNTAKIKEDGTQEAVQGETLGVIRGKSRKGEICPSTKGHPSITTFLASFAKKAFPDFIATSVQVNCGYESTVHCDRDNAGPSLVIGLGGYRNGAIFCADIPGEAQYIVKETDELKLHRQSLKAGSVLEGRLLDVNKRWQIFDGRSPHYTLPFSGRRYTLIFYVSKAWRDIPDRDAAAMRNMGFHFPARQESPSQQPTQKVASAKKCACKGGTNGGCVYPTENGPHCAYCARDAGHGYE